MAILFAVGIIQYWGFGLSLVYVEGTTRGLHIRDGLGLSAPHVLQLLCTLVVRLAD